jgi:hypothetical protein
MNDRLETAVSLCAEGWNSMNATAQMPIPATLEGLTPEFLTEVVRTRNPGVTVTGLYGG